MSKHAALDLDPEVMEALEALAASTHRSTSEIVNETLRARFEYAKEFAGSIARGVEQLDRGESLTTAEAHERLAVIRTGRV